MKRLSLILLILLTVSAARAETYNHPDVFDKIYETNAWLYGSGTGSILEYNWGYIRFLEEFFSKHEIKSIIDFGCGDWQFSQKINFDGINYTCYEVSKYVLERNRAEFAKENIKFEYTPDDWDNIESADLIVVKDVLQHFDNKTIQVFINKVLPKFKYALITNDVLPAEYINIEIEVGDFRPLDLRKEPFNVPMAEAFTYRGGASELKTCFLLVNSKSGQ